MFIGQFADEAYHGQEQHFVIRVVFYQHLPLTPLDDIVYRVFHGLSKGIMLYCNVRGAVILFEEDALAVVFDTMGKIIDPDLFTLIGRQT